MTGLLEGKVAFITGAARGQGRSHAVRLAEEGADIIAVDLASNIDSLNYDLASEDDLRTTVKLVEAQDRRIVARRADVRDQSALDAAVRDGLAELGRLDIVVANAGICSSGPTWELTEAEWQDTIDVNLTGVWHTVKAAIPTILAQGSGGAIVITGSTMSVRGNGNIAHYTATKHGVLGLTRALAVELAEHMVRVNLVMPTTCETGMLMNSATRELFTGSPHAPDADFDAVCGGLNLLPTPRIQPRDVSEAVTWLVSDLARYVTGVALPVDAGSVTRP